MIEDMLWALDLNTSANFGIILLSSLWADVEIKYEVMLRNKRSKE
jgi:hypothetical protein